MPYQEVPYPTYEVMFVLPVISIDLSLHTNIAWSLSLSFISLGEPNIKSRLPSIEFSVSVNPALSRISNAVSCGIESASIVTAYDGGVESKQKATIRAKRSIYCLITIYLHMGANGYVT